MDIAAVMIDKPPKLDDWCLLFQKTFHDNGTLVPFSTCVGGLPDLKMRSGMSGRHLSRKKSWMICDQCCICIAGLWWFAFPGVLVALQFGNSSVPCESASDRLQTSA